MDKDTDMFLNICHRTHVCFVYIYNLYVHIHLIHMYIHIYSTHIYIKGEHGVRGRLYIVSMFTISLLHTLLHYILYCTRAE